MSRLLLIVLAFAVVAVGAGLSFANEPLPTAQAALQADSWVNQAATHFSLPSFGRLLVMIGLAVAMVVASVGNPIVHREVLSSLRSQKAMFMQAMFLLVIAGLVYIHWPANGLQDIGGQQSWQIFSILSLGELLMVAMFAPAFTAAALTTEKEHGTFESIFTTAMRPWEIAAGKMVGSLTFLILLVFSGTAGLCMPFLLGGISGSNILNCLSILMLTAVYLGMIGLLVSAITHRSYRAIILTYAILGFVLFILALPAWPLSQGFLHRGGPIWQGFMHIVASFSPLQAMISLVWPNSDYAKGAAGWPPFHVTFVPVALAVIAGTAAYCLHKLHQPVAPPRPREKLKVIERDGKITARSVVFLIDPRKRKKPIDWWQNPVFIKECRTRPMLQGQWMMRAVCISMILSVVLMFMISEVAKSLYENSGSVNTTSMMLYAVASLLVVIVILVGPAISGGTICGDVETGVWDLMRTTRLPSWRIVSGKFEASIIPMVLLAAATFPSFAVLLYFDHSWPMVRNILQVMQVVTVTVVFTATAGMFFSSLFLKTSTATAWTYALIIGLGLATLLVLLGQDRFQREFVTSVLVVNPVAAVLDAAGYSFGGESTRLMGMYTKVFLLATAVLASITVFRVFQLRRSTK